MSFSDKNFGDIIKRPAAALRGPISRAALLPLRDIVVFPHMVAPLFVGRERSVAALEHAMSHDKTIFLATQKDARVDDPKPEDIHEVGTLSTVLQLLRLPDGTVKALIEGKKPGPGAEFFAERRHISGGTGAFGH